MILINFCRTFLRGFYVKPEFYRHLFFSRIIRDLRVGFLKLTRSFSLRFRFGDSLWSSSPIFLTVFPLQMITTIRRMTIEKSVRAYALSTTNSCGNRGGISYRYRTKNLRQCDTGLCLADLCSAGGRYSICELPDGEIKRRVPRVAWRNRKTRSLRRPKEKTGKAKKKKKHKRRGRKCFLAISMWRLWYRPRLRQQRSR